MMTEHASAAECPHAMIGLLFFVAIVLAIAIAALWTVSPTDDVVASLIAVPLVIQLLHRRADRLRGEGSRAHRPA